MYNKNANYCSYSPDSIVGVNFNYACYFHDRQYRNEVKHRKTRKEADQELRRVIYNKFVDADKRILGFVVSSIYYYFVRLFGGSSWRSE